MGFKKGHALTGAAVLAAGLIAAAGPAQAAAGGPLLPHPGPDGLLYIPEGTGDSGAVSGGATDRQPITVTVACQGGGSAEVSMDPGSPLFTVDCPADAPGLGSASVPGFTGSWGVFVDTTDATTRWSLTVTQPDG